MMHDASHESACTDAILCAQRKTLASDMSRPSETQSAVSPFSTACPVIRKGFLVSEILNDELQSVENKAAIQKTTALEIGPHWTAHTLLKRLIHKPECNENEVGGVNCQIGRLHYHCNSILTRLRPVETCPSILLTNSSQWFAVVF
ncbi:hypothetical protein T4A_8596 [Trichinella pseudospiralis]|uniref:Uncharacterized protein n=1 Tax=Trichinella pseudospiralis TaxID=6337 RepID=A0A0V1EGP0_TRIPS|nr:hypothetical protein T4A_8596 [Trichinella pseudospiralis]KRY82994.1 hypothetical protein T4D_12507 [Trichinella pseudospiralis]KRZ34904.1 hypothetical protein T4C_13762 [Trichinella pseudospiralis]